MAKKVIAAIAVVFVLYALVAEPRRSADLVRDVTGGILRGAQVVAESVFAFLDALV